MENDLPERKIIPSDSGILYGGARLFGRVQANRRGHFIATRFAYFLLMPIAPLESYLVLESRGAVRAGVQIEKNSLSIFIAYFRAISILLLFSVFMFGMDYFDEKKFNFLPYSIQIFIYFWFTLAALGLIGLCYSYLSPRITRATPSTEKWINETLERINA